MPESVSPRQLKETSHKVAEIDGESEQLDGSHQGDSADSNFRLKAVGSSGAKESNQFRMHGTEDRRRSSRSLRRATFQLNRKDSPAQSEKPVDHGQVVVELKSEKSDRSESSHPERQVDVRKSQNKSSSLSPTHGTVGGQSPSKSANTEPLYKIWTGEQVFLLGGRLQLGINVWQPLVTCCLINVL